MKRLNAKTLAALGFLVYFSSYVTRYNYKTIIEEFATAENVAQTAASLPLTFSFLSYGIGQLISGYIGDKVSPKKLILIGLISSSVINVLMTTGVGITVMCILWTLNGFAQSLIWPPLVKILSGSMSREDYNNAVVIVNAAGSVGTVFIHLIAPVLFKISGWETVFFFSAFIGVASVLMFSFFTRNARIQTVPKEFTASDNGQKKNSITPLILASGLIFICVAIMFHGILRDGIDTWTPSYLSNEHNLSTDSAIFVSVLVPLFSIFSYKITSVINKRLIKNELVLAILLFSIAGISTALTTVIPFMPAALFFLSLATGCMHGVNLLLVCQIPGRFAKYGKASFISGSMNFFTYVGSAVSMWGLAAITENSGWGFTFFICSAIAVVGIIMCLIALKKWKAFTKEA